MGTTVREQGGKADKDIPMRGEGDDYPMYFVSWYDCQAFILKLNKMTGKHFRLPTEAEWEYAARGGNKSRGYQYSGSNMIGNVAWYGRNSGGKTHGVGTKSSNELGIYDMSGNVYEWRQDWKDAYSSTPQTDPVGPDSGSNRVYHGGNWEYGAGGCRVSIRVGLMPDSSGHDLGFRLALSE